MGEVKILVTFTFDVSLRKWQKQGILERELELYKRLSGMGYKIGLLTYGDESDLEFREYIKDISIYPIYSYIKRPAGRLRKLLLSFWVPFRLKDIFRGYDIYKTNQMLGGWVPLIGKLLYKKRLIVRCGYEWLRNSLREGSLLKKILVASMGYPLELAVYAASDRIVVASPAMAGFVKRAFMQPQKKIVCVPNFVDTEAFKKRDAGEVYADRILYIGRLHKTKNIFNLLEALKRLGGRVGIDIIGDGACRMQLKEFAESNSLDARFLGIIPNRELPDYINRYPVFTLVSDFENNPKSVLEAMACERVVVGTDVEGIRDIIDDSVSGILVTADPAGIAQGLKKAFALDRGGRDAIGKKARGFVLENSSFESVLKKEMKAYNINKAPVLL